MEIISIEDVWKEILKKYNKKPKGWDALTYTSFDGFNDILFSNPELAWLIKRDTIYKPNPLGFGVKLDEVPKIPVTKAPPYGFRNLPIEKIMKTIEIMIKMKAPPKEIIKAVDIILHKSKRSAPVPTYKITEPACLEGPFVHQGLEAISKEQRYLSKKLDLELRKMLRMKYSMYG